MLFLPDRLTLWLAWIAASSAFFYALPLGPYGLLGWFAAVGPLTMRMVPAIGAKRMALAGLLCIGAAVLLLAGAHWYEGVLSAAVFLFGVLLAPVPITGYQDPRHLAQRGDTEEALTLALAREVGRARRHDRALTLIAANCPDEADLALLEDAFTAEVHIYAQTFRLEDGLRIIVPEIDGEAYQSMQKRVLAAAGQRGLRAVTIGVASFPDGECTASGLLDVVARDQVLYPLDRENGTAITEQKSSGVDGGLPAP